MRGYAVTVKHGEGTRDVWVIESSAANARKVLALGGEEVLGVRELPDAKQASSQGPAAAKVVPATPAQGK